MVHISTSQQEGYLWRSHKRGGRALSCPAGSWAAVVWEALCCWPKVSLWLLPYDHLPYRTPCDTMKRGMWWCYHLRSTEMLSKLVTCNCSHHLCQSRWLQTVQLSPEVIERELLESHVGNSLCAELLLLRQHRHHWPSPCWGQIQQILEDRNDSIYISVLVKLKLTYKTDLKNFTDGFENSFNGWRQDQNFIFVQFILYLWPLELNCFKSSFFNSLKA